MRLKLMALGAAVAAALVLTSCGGSADTTTTAAPTDTSTGATETTVVSDTTATTTAPVTDTTAETGGDAVGEALTISAGDDLRFKPETIHMSAGQQVELTFRNSGSVRHSLAVLKADSKLEHVLGETDEEHLHEELFFDIHEQAGGEEITETFTAPTEPGEYVFVCLVPGHATAGMVGTLVIN